MFRAGYVSVLFLLLRLTRPVSQANYPFFHRSLLAACSACVRAVSRAAAFLFLVSGMGESKHRPHNSLKPMLLRQHWLNHAFPAASSCPYAVRAPKEVHHLCVPAAGDGTLPLSAGAALFLWHMPPAHRWCWRRPAAEVERCTGKKPLHHAAAARDRCRAGVHSIT